jgi:hypothetical protein
MHRPRATALILTGVFVLLALVSSPAQQALLGDPPVWSPSVTVTAPPEHSVAALDKGLVTGGFTVNPQNREASRTFYNTYYPMSEGVAIGWTGNRSTCAEGTISSAYQDATLLRINFFRAMAGVPASVVFNSTYSGKAQKAALMMSVNGKLSHSPPSSWLCYSADGAVAAGNANLSIGYNMDNTGPTAVKGQFGDVGSSNYFVGHRRWILYPQTATMGSGSVPMSGGSITSACAVWVMDGTYGSTRPACRDGFVAWPPPGYTPYQIVYARWSFAYPGADFSSATITMSSGGSSVPVFKEDVNSGNYGERTVVWRPNNMADGAVWPKPTQDSNYTVNITGAKFGSRTSNYVYNVTVFDPAITLGQSAYPSGTPWSVPGTIQAENFDNGGEGIAFHDTTPNNDGGSSYRSPTAVDIENAGSGQAIDWVLAGEWLEYTVNIGLSGSHVLQACAANTVAGGTFRMEMDGVDKTGSVAVPATGSWTTYKTNQSSAFSLSSGIHTMRVYMVGNAGNGCVANFDWFKLVVASTPPVQSAYPSGTPWPVPGRIDVENYDRGGEGVAYHDSDSQNQGGGVYRTSEGVDVATAANTVTYVGWTSSGEWLEYTINSSGGNYRGVLSFACSGPGGTFRILLDGANLFGKTFTIPDTGGWEAFVWMKTSAIVPIPAGQHILRLEMVGGVGNLNYMKFEKVSSLTPEKQAGRTAALKPILIPTSNRGTGDSNGWLAVDGDIKTGWKGAEGAGGWWMAFAYDHPILMKGVDIRFGENSPTNVLYLGSLDLLQWFDLREVWSTRAAGLEYLWMIFPDDGTGRSPDVREVLVK